MTNAVKKKEQPFKKGDILLKRSRTRFGQAGPTLTVRSVEAFGDGRYRINGKYVFRPEDVEIITEEEALNAELVWEDSGKISTSLKPDLNSSCFREDNGNPKQKFPEDGFQSVLFQARMRNPEGGYEAYRCKHCSHIHIGKSQGLYEGVMLV
jgi:hypothetical protein